MLEAVIRKIVGRKLPIVKSSSDLIDPRGRKIANDNFVKISNLPELYFELESAGGIIEIDTLDLIGDRIPIEHDQFLAGAIMHYELTRREGFRIAVNSKTYGLFDLMKIRSDVYGVFERRASIDVHEDVAETYVQIAGLIYNAFVNANDILSIK